MTSSPVNVFVQEQQSLLAFSELEDLSIHSIQTSENPTSSSNGSQKYSTTLRQPQQPSSTGTGNLIQKFNTTFSQPQSLSPTHPLNFEHAHRFSSKLAPANMSGEQSQPGQQSQSDPSFPDPLNVICEILDLESGATRNRRLFLNATALHLKEGEAQARGDKYLFTLKVVFGLVIGGLIFSVVWLAVSFYSLLYLYL